MALKVISFAAYLTRTDEQWRGEDWNAQKFVKAVKGKHVNGYAWVPVCGNSRYLSESNADDSIGWFGEMAAKYLTEHPTLASLLVPVPNSDCTTKNRKLPRTLRLAEAIASRVKRMKVWDGLRWKIEMTPSSKGGTRDPQILYDNLVVTEKLPVGRVILVDDVRTTGAHLIASAARIKTKGGTCRLALCAGRTVLAQEENPFEVGDEEHDDFEPQ